MYLFLILMWVWKLCLLWVPWYNRHLLSIYSMPDIMAHVARNWSRYINNNDTWRLGPKKVPQAIRGSQRTDLESSISLKLDSVLLGNHFLVGGMREVICSTSQFACPYSSYQDPEQSSLKPIQAFSSITLNQGIPADLFKTAFSSYQHDLPIPHHFSYCPQPTYSTRETKCFLEAVSKEKLGATEWAPEVVKPAENCSVQFYMLHVQSCWPSVCPFPPQRLLFPITLPTLLGSSLILPTQFCWRRQKSLIKIRKTNGNCIW